jgi:uncharacterized protein involved in outer membrane biogenesis
MRWKWIKWFVGVFALLVIALFITAYAVLSSYDFDNLKPKITRMVKDATGRELKLLGEMDLEVGLTPVLEVKSVRFQNAPWGSRPDLIILKRLVVQMDLLSLISGNIEFKRLILLEPDILIEKDRSGKSNLDFEISKKVPQVKPGEGAPAGGMEIPNMAFEEIRIEKAKLTYKDDQSGQTQEVILDRLTARAENIHSAVSLEVKGSYRHKPFEVEGTFGPMAALMDSERPWKMRVKAGSGGFTLNVAGSIREPLKGRGVSLRVSGDGRSLSDVIKLAGKDGALEEGPFKLEIEVKDTGKRAYEVPEFKFVLGVNKLQGSARVNLAGDRPQIKAVLASQNLDLRPLISGNKGKQLPASKSTKPRKKRDRIFPYETLPYDALNKAGADVRFRAEKIMLPGLALNDLDFHLVIQNGRLTLKPLKAFIGGGALDAHFDLKPYGKTAVIAHAIKITNLDLGRMLKELDMKDLIEGTLNMEADLKGRGNSIADLMAGLNGKTVLVMDKGRINNKYIDMLGGDLSSGLFRMLNPLKQKTNYSEYNCFVSGFGIKKGIADVTALVFDTRTMSVVGNGRVNLRTEELDLGLKPAPKKGMDTGVLGKVSLSLGELTKPLKLAGTLAKPSLSIDETQAAMTLGKAVGGTLLFGPVGIAAALASHTQSEGNPCLKAIEMAKKGVRVSGDKEAEKKKGLVEKGTDGVKDAFKGVGGGLKKLIGR